MSLLSPRGRDRPMLRRSIPWRAEDLVRWMTGSALAGVLVIVGWYISAGQADSSRQVVPLNFAIGGVVLGGVVNLTWLLRGWHAVGERRREVIRQLPTGESASRSAAGFDTAIGAESGESGQLVGEGTRYFHRPPCPLASGRGWTPVPLAEHLRAGREPCGVCKP